MIIYFLKTETLLKRDFSIVLSFCMKLVANWQTCKLKSHISWPDNSYYLRLSDLYHYFENGLCSLLFFPSLLVVIIMEH